MTKKPKLNKIERHEIEILYNKKYSIRSIAKTLGRSPNTISREIKRNYSSEKDGYFAKDAHHKAYFRNKYKKKDWQKIEKNKEIRKYIIEKIKLYWNPFVISKVMEKEERFYVSKTTIYKWLYSNRGQYYCKYLYSKKYKVKKRKDKTKRVLIPNRIGIEKRSKTINLRLEKGHLEVDTVVSGKNGSGALLVAIDRKTRFVKIKKLYTLKPQETVDNLKQILENTKVKSITFDNGFENRYHEQLGVQTFFTDPYSSWQKGTVENVNKMIRRFIPKGTNIFNLSNERIKWVEDVINNQPRKILGFRSALEVSSE